MPSLLAARSHGSAFQGFIGAVRCTRVRLVRRARILKQPQGCFFLFWAAAQRDCGVGILRETLTYWLVCSRLRAKFRLALTLLATPKTFRIFKDGLLRGYSAARDAQNVRTPANFTGTRNAESSGLGSVRACAQNSALHSRCSRRPKRSDAPIGYQNSSCRTLETGLCAGYAVKHIPAATRARLTPRKAAFDPGCGADNARWCVFGCCPDCAGKKISPENQIGVESRPQSL